jgi:sensor histidine kinase YesM
LGRSFGLSHHIDHLYLSILSQINKRLKEELRQQRKTVFGRKRYLLHVAAWILGLWYMVREVFGDGESSSTVNNAKVDGDYTLFIPLMGSVVGAVMVYFFLLYVIPYARYKRQRRYLWLGVILNCTLWMMMIALCGAIVGLQYGSKVNLEDNDLTLILMLSSIFSGVTAGFFFSLYYFIDLYDQQKGLNTYRKVLTDKLQAETNFLKTQINPHFLFNTLNNIYSLTLSRSYDAAVITRQLKSLIIYILQECQKDKVSLAGEIEFLKNYIDLEQLRNKQEQVDIQLQVTGDPEGKEIAPLLLVNFIENAFKHGVKAGVDHAFVRISLLIMDQKLSLDMINSKPPGGYDAEKSVKAGGGIGVRNVERRLALLYPERHKLRISQSEKDYSVYLTIDL